MPDSSCAIANCSNRRGKKSCSQVSFFKIPSGKDEFNDRWANDLIKVICIGRVIDQKLKKKIEGRNLHICSDHFTDDQILTHESRSSLIPGSIPTRKLPDVSPQNPEPKARSSYASICEKKYKNDRTELSISSYKSFADAARRITSMSLSSKWTNTINKDYILVTKSNQLYVIPEFEIYIQQSLEYIIRVYCQNLPDDHVLYSSYAKSFNNVTAPVLIEELSKYNICSGVEFYDSNTFPHVVQKIFDINHSSASNQQIFYRSRDCRILSISAMCDNCSNYNKLHLKQQQNKNIKLNSPLPSKAPLSACSSSRLVATVKDLRNEVAQLKKQFKPSLCVDVNQDLHDDIKTIFNDNADNMSPFMKLFWTEQLKYISSSKTGIRYHPEIIRYSLNLLARSPSVYDEILYDEEKGTGCLILPSKRRLRDYKNYIKPETGLNYKILNELISKTSSFMPIEKFVIITFDGMKIQDNLVWDKHSGNLIGYVDLGDDTVNHATLKKVSALATHVLVFMLRSVVNPFKFSLANFATTSATALQIYSSFWKIVQSLERKCHLKVVAVTCDGASANRNFFEMHQYFECNSSMDFIYKVENFYDFSDFRYIYFISDPPHLIKTFRNCLFKSGANNSNRLMWNNNVYLLWSHISKFFFEDQELGLHLLPKLSVDHINLNSFSIMNVRLAAQVLSSTVSNVLAEYGPDDVSETAYYCGLIDSFFDIMNIKNCQDHVSKQKTFLKPFSNLDDDRFHWLINVFLKYFYDWKQSIDNRVGPFTTTERSNMFISHQTFTGLRITSHSIIECIQFLLNSGVDYVLTERFCQDPLENYFGQQRAINRRKDNPNLRDIGYGDNAIRNAKVFNSIVGGNSSGSVQSHNIDDTPVPCRKRKIGNS